MNGLFKILFSLCIVTVFACSENPTQKKVTLGETTTESFEASVPPLKGCRFQNPSVIYAVNATIPPNAVICEADSGPIHSIQILNSKPLPAGLQLTSSNWTLIGSPSHPQITTQFKVYIENSAGYQIIPLQITVQ